MSSPTPANSRNSFKFQTLFGIVPVAIGLVSLAGWYTGNLKLAGAIGELPPTHFLTAILFLFCTAGIVFSSSRFRSALMVTAASILSIGAFDLYTKLIGQPFDYSSILELKGLDNETFHTTEIGTVSFIFIGLAWVFTGVQWKYRKIVSGAMGTFPLAAGLGTLIGFAAGYPEMLRWGHSTELGFTSALAFAATGAAIVLESRRRAPAGLLSGSHYIPVGILVGGLVVSFCVRQAIHLQEIKAADQIITQHLAELSHTYEFEMARRIAANERLANSWNGQERMEQSAWERDALSHLNYFKTYQSLVLLDADLKFKWGVPTPTNGNPGDFKPADIEVRKSELQHAQKNRKTVVSGSVSLDGREIRSLSYSPIYNGNEFKGFIVGVFRVDKFFGLTIPEKIRRNYSVAIVDRGTIIYSTDAEIANTSSKTDQAKPVNFAGTPFVIRIRPSQKYVSELIWRKGDLALMLGTLISILFSWSILLALRARHQNRITATANKLLKSEIEERKRVGKKLRETSTFQEAILNGANYIIISTNRSGLITSFNRTAEYHLGYTSDEVVGKLTLDHFHDRTEITKYGEELARRFGYESITGFEPLVNRARDNIADERDWTYICKDGSSFPVTLSVTATVDERGKITGFLGIARDNSQLHIASRLLVESEERFKAFVNNTPALTYIKDKYGRYRFVNTNFEKLFKVSQDKLIGRSDFALGGKTLAKEVIELEKRVLETGVPEESVELVHLSDEQSAHFLFVRFVLPMPGGEDCLGVIAIDLSAQKAIEEELREASYAAVEASRMKSEFLANMSHEIRTPMNGVLGMLEVLLDTPLNASQREYANVIQESAKSLLMILDDILDFSKLEAGKLTFETIEFDLRLTVENTLALFGEQCEAKTIEMTSIIEPDVPVGLLGDPGRVRQVLTNLIGNGVKFTEKGEVAIRISKAAESGDSVSLLFEVCDTGIGIPEDAQLSLFKAFVQADGSMVRKYGGTGLGLSISKQLVEMMNGEISVESIPGHGSTFRFTAVFGLQKSVKQFVPTVDLSGRRILIVDDHGANRESIANQLRGLGIITVEATDGQSCIETLKKHAEELEPFDIVILDHEMPGISGFETAELIKYYPAISDTKIVLMPSHGRRGHARAAIKSGISAYLIKPVRQVELFDCVSRILGGELSDDATVETMPAAALITRHSLLESRMEYGTPILVVASSVVHQNVISMQLELLGYRAEIVSNSEEAFQALKKRAYSLIFLDLDGQDESAFVTAEGIKRIVSQEVSIIGITADPSESERDAALKAGMVDYLSVPFSEEHLRKTVAEFVKDSVPENGYHRPVYKEPVSKNDKEMEMYVRQLLEEIGPEMLAMIVSLFAEDAARHMRDLSKASNAADFDEIAELAGSLGVVCENIHAAEMRDICLELEIGSRKKDPDNVRKLSEQLQSKHEAVIAQLENLELEALVTNSV